MFFTNMYHTHVIVSHVSLIERCVLYAFHAPNIYKCFHRIKMLKALFSQSFSFNDTILEWIQEWWSIKL